MAKRDEIDAHFVSPRLPRIVATVTRSLEFSSPAPGRPTVLWMVGITPGIVREHWSTQGEVPYEVRGLPPHASAIIPDAPNELKCYSLGVTRKLVVYERTHPEIRLVLLLDAPFDSAGETWQPIMQSRVERDRGVDPRKSRLREERLWDEVCRVERRGRPHGTGHPKKPVQQHFLISPNLLSHLRKLGLHDKDLQVVFGRWKNKTFAEIGRDLGVSAQAIWKRWQLRIEPRLKQVNPKFSTKSFCFVRDPK
jgi:hypothetical protein